MIKAKIEQLELVQNLENSLRIDFEAKQAKAANLESYEIQLAEMQELLETMFRQLPSKTEMDKLLVDVSQTALGAGIDVQLFQPNAEAFHDFYAERPISVRMLGDYHQFGEFVSGVASLPRVVILTMHDIALRRATDRDVGANAGDGRLILEGTVKTYRYIDEEEAAAAGRRGECAMMSPSHIKSTLVIMLIVMSSLITACSGRQDDLNRYIAEVKSRPATPIPPIPPVRTYTPYEYEGLTGRDPFRQSTSEGSDQVTQSGGGKGPRPDLQRPREYLERFELDTLSMVGTFSKETSDWALDSRIRTEWSTGSRSEITSGRITARLTAFRTTRCS